MATSFSARALSTILKVSVGLVFLLVAGGLIAVLILTKPRPKTSEIGEDLLTVRAVRARAMDVARVWEGFGTARARYAADVSAQVAGRIVERPEGIEPGNTIDKGSLIALIDTTDYEQQQITAAQVLAQLRSELDVWDVQRERIGEQLRLAESTAELAEREYNRSAEALELGGANLTEVEAKLSAYQRVQREAAALRERYDLMTPQRLGLEARISAQKAALRLAEENLARTRVAAPITGTLQRVGVTEGELVSPGTPIARVVDLSLIELPLAVPVSAADSVRIGDRAEIHLDTATASSWTGTVARIAPEADPASRTITLFVEVRQEPDASPLLLPGTFVVGTVYSRSDEPQVVVPRAAIRGSGVVVLEDGGETTQAQARDIDIAFHADRLTFPELASGRFAQWTVLAAGLEPGTLVAVSNLDQLEDRMHVRIDEVELRWAADPATETQESPPADPTRAGAAR